MKRLQLFQLNDHHTTVKSEMLAGVIGFLTVVYIVAVNSMILAEAGIPFQGAAIATILTSFVGCLLMGLWANAPIILVPGMGINALFTFTLVQSKGLSWQEALGVVFVSGILFVMIAFSKLATKLNSAIPQTLKDAISVGLGLFLMLIGLEKGGIVVRGGSSLIELGDLSDLKVMATILTLIFTIILFLRNTKGYFLISILFGTVLGTLFGIIPHEQTEPISYHEYSKVFAGLSFGKLVTFPFWIAVFSLTMVIVFENIGLSHSHTKLIGNPNKFKRTLQVNAISAALSGILGSSPTVAAVESTAAISAGGKTGLTSITSAFLFLGSIFIIPYLKWIPDNAIAPILILIGGLMTLNICSMDLRDITEALPSVFIIVMIPFTYSIADGIAIGFILYPLLKVSIGKAKDVSPVLYVISCLFLLYFVIQYI